jgi:hypothetical protein
MDAAMKSLNDFKIYGHSIPMTPRNAKLFSKLFLFVLLPLIVSLAGYVAYLIATVVDSYLGIGVIWTMISLLVVSIQLDFQKPDGTERKLSLIPARVRAPFGYFLLLLSLLVRKITACKAAEFKGAQRRAASHNGIGYAVTDVTFKESESK